MNTESQIADGAQQSTSLNVKVMVIDDSKTIRRSAETLLKKVGCEVVTAIDGRIPVMVDSGFRRGTDIFKALALGANAVCLGRAYIWGLAAFGQPGVEKVLEMLSGELSMVMGQMGTSSLSDIGTRHIGNPPG